MRLYRPVVLSRLIYPEALFRIKTDSSDICLTFDDGPDPDSTPGILDVLDNYRVKAIFFCIGLAAAKYPDLMDLIISRGHTIGNHGFRHISGWKTSLAEYADDISKAADVISSHLFRPAFGGLRPAHYRTLKKQYKIIFWDLMPYDFDSRIGKEKSLKLLKDRLRKGSVIVLHDKVSSTALSFLGEFLEYAQKNGYKFIIPDL